MTLPFSKAEFLGVFAVYNEAIWPLQPIAELLGLVAVALVLWRPAWADRAIAAILSAFWLGTGVAYHWGYFAPINRAAWLFGALFVLAGAIFLVEGVLRGRIRFAGGGRGRTVPAACLVTYALVIYPLWGLGLTHPYPQTPLFGVTPCPTAIFTIGMLLLAEHRAPWLLAAIPLAWSIIGGTAALLLDVPADWALLAAAVTWLLVQARRRLDAT